MSNTAMAHPDLDLDARLDLITRGLGRVDDEDRRLIEATLHDKTDPSLFWGVAPTGRPHIGYLVPFVKIAELVEAGVEVFAYTLRRYVYAFLVNYKHPRSLVAHRAEYYKFALGAVFEAILGLPVSRIQFYQETAFADTPEFVNDAYELLSLTSQAAARSPNDELRNATMMSPLMAISKYAPFTEAGAPDGYIFSVALDDGQYQHYASYEEIETDFLSQSLSSKALKSAVAKAMVKLLAPIRTSFEANPRWRAVLDLAYPGREQDALASTAVDASERFCIPDALREISNERVKLVPFNSTLHAGEFMRVAKQHPEIWTHGPVGPFDSAQSFVSDFIETSVRPRNDMALYTVIDKTKSANAHNGIDKEGVLAGLIAYIGTSPINLCTEIGFVITLPPFQRTHVTSNAVGLLLNFALNSPEEGGLGFRRVQWMASSVNHRSIGTAEKMGFTKEGIIRWDRLYPGGGKKGKQSSGKKLLFHGRVTHMNEDDLGRDSVMLSMCWDDWYLEGKKEHVNRRMG
ncbi:Tyrosine--tRNA ligase [Drechslerella dactyloides]|uniref:Tyrosine--tRNA ligase n=1 Tax=Drechslerella dactyloides TaxID=74499 RepID=A0AAD6NLQ3_DREDA|nr:Tyrosine--tRNA ligase [Drechslerella dactyloides]